MESEDRPGLADLRTAGIGATAPGGHPTQMGGSPIPVIAGPEQAQDFVDARIAEGSDYITIILTTGAPGPGRRPSAFPCKVMRPCGRS